MNLKIEKNENISTSAASNPCKNLDADIAAGWWNDSNSQSLESISTRLEIELDLLNSGWVPDISGGAGNEATHLGNKLSISWLGFEGNGQIGDFGRSEVKIWLTTGFKT